MFNGKINYGAFSIAMLVHQRVYSNMHDMAQTRVKEYEVNMQLKAKGSAEANVLA